MATKEPTSIEKNYYAAANSCKGFFSLFGSIFSPEKLKKIYILKGGPGCGKSTAIKRVSQKATELGYAVENYYCSSSPSSYDGVIIPELSCAVLDGTAPHTVDPKYPGVCENIINLGEAWNIEKANEINTITRELTARKNSAYKKAYAYLSSCMSAREVKMNCIAPCILENKMIRAVERLCSKYKFKANTSECKEVFTDCVSGYGNIHLDTFERHSEIKYFIRDYADISSIFLDTLSYELIKRGARLTIAVDPLYPEQYKGIFVNDLNLSFTMYNDDYCRNLDKRQIPYKIINLARFCATAQFKRNKVFYKYADKSEKILMNGAIKQLSIAASTHDEIEKYYYSITDFSVTNKITEDLLNKIF